VKDVIELGAHIFFKSTFWKFTYLIASDVYFTYKYVPTERIPMSQRTLYISHSTELIIYLSVNLNTYSADYKCFK